MDSTVILSFLFFSVAVFLCIATVVVCGSQNKLKNIIQSVRQNEVATSYNELAIQFSVVVICVLLYYGIMLLFFSTMYLVLMGVLAIVFVVVAFKTINWNTLPLPYFQAAVLYVVIFLVLLVSVRYIGVI